MRDDIEFGIALIGLSFLCHMVWTGVFYVINHIHWEWIK